MKRNELYEARRAKVSSDVREYVSFSFDIVNRIQDILTNKGMTQHDLAVLLNKTDAEISKWMRGTHNFTISTVKSIENVLGKKIICIYTSDHNSLKLAGYKLDKKTATYIAAEPNPNF